MIVQVTNISSRMYNIGNSKPQEGREITLKLLWGDQVGADTSDVVPGGAYRCIDEIKYTTLFPEDFEKFAIGKKLRIEFTPV